MTATTLEILEQSGPLAVSGRLDARLDDLRATDRALARVTDDGARPAGVAAGIAALAVGLAVLASLLLGIPAVTGGTLAPVELSVIVLTPLAVFEAANALPAAAVQLHRSRQAAARVVVLLDGSTPRATAATCAPGARSRSSGRPASARRRCSRPPPGSSPRSRAG